LQLAKKLKGFGIGNWRPHLSVEIFQNKAPSHCWQRVQISEAPVWRLSNSGDLKYNSPESFKTPSKCLHGNLPSEANLVRERVRQDNARIPHRKK
jgi:hypothetical protein